MGDKRRGWLPGFALAASHQAPGGQQGLRLRALSCLGVRGPDAASLAGTTAWEGTVPWLKEDPSPLH